MLYLRLIEGLEDLMDWLRRFPHKELVIGIILVIRHSIIAMVKGSFWI